MSLTILLFIFCRQFNCCVTKIIYLYKQITLLLLLYLNLKDTIVHDYYFFLCVLSSTQFSKMCTAHKILQYKLLWLSLFYTDQIYLVWCWCQQVMVCQLSHIKESNSVVVATNLIYYDAVSCMVEIQMVSLECCSWVWTIIFKVFF